MPEQAEKKSQQLPVHEILRHLKNVRVLSRKIRKGYEGSLSSAEAYHLPRHEFVKIHWRFLREELSEAKRLVENSAQDKSN